jgi:hypothetical protein
VKLHTFIGHENGSYIFLYWQTRTGGQSRNKFCYLPKMESALHSLARYFFRAQKWVRSFYSGDPDVITGSCQSVWLRNTRSLARHWQTHLSDDKADSTSLLNQAHVQYQSGIGGSTAEKPAETQTSIELASHLVRAPNLRSGVRIPNAAELGALNKWLASWMLLCVSAGFPSIHTKILAVTGHMYCFIFLLLTHIVLEILLYFTSLCPLTQRVHE